MGPPGSGRLAPWLGGDLRRLVAEGPPVADEAEAGALQPVNGVEAGDQLAHQVGSAIALARRPR